MVENLAFLRYCLLFQVATSFVIGSRTRNGHSLEGNLVIRGSDNHRASSSAVYERRTNAEERFIKGALLKNGLFQDLPERSLLELLTAFEKISASRNEVICEQGDDSDFVYMISEGECTVTVDGSVVPDPYGTIGPEFIFGELGILYNETRAATVSAKSKSVTLFRVRGDTFMSALGKHSESLATLQEIDNAINQVQGTQPLYGGDVIVPYQPERIWLWRQFSGTILNISLQTTVLNMALCLAFITYAKDVTGDTVWSFDSVPDKSLPFIQRLSEAREIWEFQKSLTTFILTFFVNQSFAFWRETYNIARGIQGRLNDVHLLIVTNVKRNEDGSLPAESQDLIDDIGQFSRLFHVLMWASVSRRFAVLNTPQGLQRMESRGLMTRRQLETLKSLENVPKDQLQNAPLEWMLIRAMAAMDKGSLANDNACKERLLREITRLRGTYYTIGDNLDGRMPLAYVHLVQILVDTFILIAPVALYADLGVYSLVAVGILTLFYTGLLNLAKIFLDPFNNEDLDGKSIFMDTGVFIRESNSGSMLWKRAGEKVPFDL